MHECLEFHIGHCVVNGKYFVIAEFACKHHTFYAHTLPKFDGKNVGGVGLRGEVNSEIGSNFFAKRHETYIAYKHCVRTDFLQKLKVFLCIFEVGVFGKYVDCDVYFFAERMRKIYAFYHLFFGEVVRKGTQRKLFSAYIHGVRTEVESSFEFFEIARRHQ